MERTLPLPSLVAVPSRVATVPAVATALSFIVLFGSPIATMARDWWTSPDAGHGLLLAPVAVWLAWKRGLAADRAPQRVMGAALLVAAVAMRYVGALAAELFTMRVSVLLAGVGLVVWYAGWRQLRHWWLPTLLLFLSVPLPELIMQTLAFPLQLTASEMGAALLEWRNIPVHLDGNVIRLPGHTLFVMEACSGQHSLSSLIALGVLMGGLWLRSVPARLLIVLLALPIAILLNGVRVFLTGFLVFFVNPALGHGFMHVTEGWIIFIVAFLILGGLTWVIGRGEKRLQRRAA